MTKMEPRPVMARDVEQAPSHLPVSSAIGETGCHPTVDVSHSEERPVHRQSKESQRSSERRIAGLGRPRAFAVTPLFHVIKRRVLAADRLHGDDSTIRMLAKCTQIRPIRTMCLLTVPSLPARGDYRNLFAGYQRN
ncbi:hypothetical protein [Bradyrhizobium sp. USDA 4451]